MAPWPWNYLPRLPLQRWHIGNQPLGGGHQLDLDRQGSDIEQEAIHLQNPGDFGGFEQAMQASEG
jgi:hypothetical protein